MKKIIIITLIFAICCLSFGCAKEQSLKDDKVPITVTDNSGRTVSFDKPVKTVATTWGGGVAIYLFALGVGDRLIASNSTTDFYSLFINTDNITSVGKWSLDKEALAKLAPDLYIHGSAATEFLDGANEVGVQSYGMGFNSFDDIIKNIEDLGILFGVEDRAQYVVQYLNRFMDMINQRVGSLPETEKHTVVMLGPKTGEVSSDIYDTIEAMIIAAGGVSCIPEDIAKRDSITNVGLETIFSWNPEYFFLEDYYCELTVESIMTDPTWQPLKAVESNHVYALPCMLDVWSIANPSCYLGTLYISMKMYPDLFDDVDFEKTVIEFYHEVYGLNVTMEMLGVFE